jgi:hypothetical protein
VTSQRALCSVDTSCRNARGCRRSVSPRHGTWPAHHLPYPSIVMTAISQPYKACFPRPPWTWRSQGAPIAAKFPVPRPGYASSATANFCAS